MLRARGFGLCAGVGLIGLASWAVGQGQRPGQGPRPPSGTKHVLVVSTTAGFRHPSIEVGEKVLRELAAKSGDITLDFASVNPADPQYALTDAEKAELAKVARPGGGGFGPGNILVAPLRAQADRDGDKEITPAELAALGGTWFDRLDADKAGKLSRQEFAARIGDLLAAPGPGNRQPQGATVKGRHRERRTAPPVNPGGFLGGGLFTALDADKDGTLTRDEMQSAFKAWADTWDADKDGLLSVNEIRDGLNAKLPRPNIPGFGRNPKADAAVKRILAEKMSPEALKRYDGVVFLNTTGDLPIPDFDAFSRWVEDGHAFVGMHAAADTLHGNPAYAKMLGAEFDRHFAQVEVDIANEDPAHPANAGLGKNLTAYEEVYLYKNYDPKNVHVLLDMDEHPNTAEPGHYPVSWTREVGKGRVFYTSLGHREDVWDPSWKDQNGKRENPPEVAEAYQRHLLNGLRWALKLPPQGANGRPQAARNRGEGRPQAERKGGGGFAIPSGGTALAPVVVEQGDKDGDGKLSRAEFTGLAGSWFDKLDPEKAGTVGYDQFTPRFSTLLPRTQQGFGPALFVGPGLFAACDVDKDMHLTRDELVGSFGRWFDRWDAGKAGKLDEAALHAGFDAAWPQTRFGRGGNAQAAAKALDQEVAKGADFKPRDPVTPLPPAEEARRFVLPPGYRMELVLAEPDVEEPVAAVFDGNGRMYVAEMRTYMQDIDGKNEHDPISRISRHEDTDGDGTFDRHTVFVDKLVLPRFVLPWQGDSVLAMETDADDVFKYTDTDGDGVADRKELFTQGVGRRGNLEHQQSGMVWALDNWIYTTYNAFRVRWTPRGILREPTAPNGGQWGLAQDDFGKVWFVDAGGERGPINFQAPIVYGAFSSPDQFEDGFEETHPLAPGIGDVQGGTMRLHIKEQTLNHFTAACGQEIVRGDRLPADLRGDLVFCEPVGRMVRRAKIVTKDGLTQLRNAYPKAEFIRSTDPLFRPINLLNAPDGTLYLVDMYRGIIQEGTWVNEGSYLRKKVQQYGLDKVIRHGRIWRLRFEGLERDRTRPRMLDETAAQLVKHLEHPNGWWRDQAQKLLVLKQDRSVVPTLKEMARTSPNELARFHALWTLEGLGALDAPTVREALASKSPKMRVQAIRLAESLYEAGDTSLAADVKALTKDRDPDVAIQAMLTLNHLKVPDATAVLRATVDATRSRGVREIGGQALQGQGGGNEFAGLRLAPDERKLLARGSAIYKELCISCHGIDGKGAPLAGAPAGTTMAPPLAGSGRVQGHRDYVTSVLLNGLVGPIDDKNYQSLMAPMGSNDDEWIASVASYVRNAFGNSASFVRPAEVAKARAAAKGRTFPWTVAELESSLPGALTYRPDWKVTASHHPEFAPYAINSPGFVRWDTGAPQEVGMWFQVELPEPATLGEIQLDAPGGPMGGDSSPRGYKVQVSTDGTSWSDPVAEGKGNGPSTRIALKPTPAKFVRITLTAADDVAVWAIQRTRLFEAVRPSAEDTRPRIGTMALADVLDAAAKTHGDPRRGERLFTELSCVACHTVRAGEPAKGPFLGTVSQTYRRRDLAEQVLQPSKVIAKGYTTNILALKDGRQVEGFVVRETPDALTLRTAAAQEQTIPVADIDERGQSPKSLMPEGLVANLSVEDFASLLDYLESLAPAAPARAGQ